MRVMVEEYAKGGRGAYETSNDGLEYLGEWVGPVRMGERTASFIEAVCDSTPWGVDRLLEAMTWLTEELKKRKESLTRGSK
jgi:hypothetical protein